MADNNEELDETLDETDPDDDDEDDEDEDDAEEEEEERAAYKKHYFYAEQILSSTILNEMDEQIDYLSNNFDAVPKEGSNRYVISSGIKKYVDDYIEAIANARY